ncbi:ParB/RepB/Spo0J family partition protein [Frateuria defendens]|uniref:ParB/RepB/Spo0J family partition protein n=1 Tax=Frateuria defendens TaxID=2219559 RepID=UPI00069F4D07|nr:ParB N-terminal domain-containing protein [Frateuria defendens]
MTPQETLDALAAAEVQHLSLASLQTDEALQPREARMVPYREQTRVQVRSDEHTGTLRLALEASHSIQLEPLLVAQLDGGLFVVDGHHRLRAYRLAGRETVPVRVVPMGHREAVMVSKLVNCSGRALEMHAEQKRDAAWQYLAEVTKRGTDELPAGESLRTIAGRFGVARTTIDRMRDRLPAVSPADYPEAAHDPGTGFPRWRYVREAGAGWPDMENYMSAEQLTQHEAEKLARKIGALLDKASPEATRRALAMLANEAKSAASNADALAFLAETAEPEDEGY